MKKVIAAAAGLFRVGSAVSAAAAVTLSGDARARWYYEKYQDGNILGRDEEKKTDEHWSGRVRVKIDADTKGGAYIRTRIRLADARWGTGNTRTNKDNSIYTDWAYIGMPIGPVTFEGGSMPVNITKWSVWDARADQAVVKYGFDATELMLIWQKRFEADPGQGADYSGDDNDIQNIWGVWKQGFRDWNFTGAFVYTEDSLSTNLADYPPGTPEVPEIAARDLSGWGGTFNAAGPIGPVAMVGEIAVMEDSVNGQVEDKTGYGFYLQGSMDFGAASATLNGGYTKNGYVADDDFGFIMIGGASAITPEVAAQVGQNGDTWWIGGIAGYQVSEKLSLKGTLVYASSDTADRDNNTLDPFGIKANYLEVAGEISYATSDNSSIDVIGGWLGIDPDDNVLNDRSKDPYGGAVTFNVDF
jgi:hypothetical protein